ncbi:carboxymuconolactone decarboxylase family protein [Amorphus sp. 3PC139-8]|uniref:carboxymuconolactone decarboxylase family protein n=1 Tax=Amorphus sp. 3PC139-8 TaxID=2735676 RepID=UPI00345C85CD
MSKDFAQIAADVESGLTLLNGAVPDAMAGFLALGQASHGEGALTAKIKELIALGIAIAVHCDGCISYHAKAVHEAGATREEVAEMIAVAVHMGGGPSVVYGGEALKAFDTFAKSGSKAL